MTSDIRVLRADEQANVIVHEDFVITVYHPAATGDVFDTLHEGRSIVLREHPKVSLLSIVPGSAAGLASADGRERGKASLKEMEADLNAMAVVIESGSLASSLTRTIMNTMALVTRRRFAWKTFEAVESASEWVASQLTSRLSPADVAALVERARSITS